MHKIKHLKMKMICISEHLSFLIFVRVKSKYRKTRKNLDTWKYAVIILKFEQYRFWSWVQKMQTDWQTVKIWVYTVCLDLSVRKLRIITVICKWAVLEVININSCANLTWHNESNQEWNVLNITCRLQDLYAYWVPTRWWVWSSWNAYR